MSYTHLVVKPYDPSLDYAEFCRDTFGNNKCLVMLEKKGGDHLHIQGELAVTETEYTRLRDRLTSKHYRKIQDAKSHPVKRRRVAADDTGFQYMAKELPTSVVVYKQLITDEELKDLYELSNKHREELQEGLTDFIRDHVTTAVGLEYTCTCPNMLHKLAAQAAVEYYQSTGKMQPPNLRLLVRHAIAKHFYSLEMRDYLATLIM